MEFEENWLEFLGSSSFKWGLIFFFFPFFSGFLFFIYFYFSRLSLLRVCVENNDFDSSGCLGLKRVWIFAA